MKLKKRTLRFVADKSNQKENVEGARRNVPTLRRRAAEVMNYRLLRKIILISVAIGIAVLMLCYAFVLIYDRTGRFSVLIHNPDEDYAITLCETPDFKLHSSRLTNDQQVKITNICGDSLPQNLDSIYGQHNGENYLAYTFHCKNIGEVDTSMHYEMTFNNVTNHIDEAIRVRLYVDGEYNDYAKTRSDGTGKEIHYCDYQFVGNYLVCKNTIGNVKPDEYVKFTVVIWLEGDDEDCNDSLISGMIKFDMIIEAKPPVEENAE